MDNTLFVVWHASVVGILVDRAHPALMRVPVYAALWAQTLLGAHTRKQRT